MSEFKNSEENSSIRGFQWKFSNLNDNFAGIHRNYKYDDDLLHTPAIFTRTKQIHIHH